VSITDKQCQSYCKEFINHCYTMSITRQESVSITDTHVQCQSQGKEERQSEDKCVCRSLIHPIPDNYGYTYIEFRDDM